MKVAGSLTVAEKVIMVAAGTEIENTGADLQFTDPTAGAATLERLKTPYVVVGLTLASGASTTINHGLGELGCHVTVWFTDAGYTPLYMIINDRDKVLVQEDDANNITVTNFDSVSTDYRIRISL